MPLEIRELHIQVNVGQQGGSQQGQQAPAAQQQASGDNNNQDEVLKKCVEEVIDVINKQHER